MHGARADAQAFLSQTGQQARNATLLAYSQAGMAGSAAAAAAANGESLDLHASDVLSRFHVSYACSGASKGFSVVSYIEPLYGLLRHPRAWNCTADVPASEALLMDVSYLVLAARAAAAVRVPPSLLAMGSAPFDPPPPPDASAEDSVPSPCCGTRFILFDIGASTYDDLSQGWLHARYAARGIRFDRILLWESAHDLDTRNLFRRVPDEVYDAYQFFHEPVTADPASPRNPLNILRRLARPQDFVAFKLDIDHAWIEQQFIKQILQDREISKRIDELFWENHFNDTGLIRCCWWWQPMDMGMDRCGATRLFQSLRRLGIRAHAWP